MNPEQLQVIKNRMEKATPGPWYSHADGTVFLKHTQEIADVWTDNEEADAEFIANARQDIPNLITEVERLREVFDNAAGYISIGESAKANDIICRALGVDINHYGIYGEEEAE